MSVYVMVGRYVHMLTVLTTIAVVADVLFILMILFFMRGLKWRDKEQRVTIAGFITMVAGAVLNISVLITLFRAIG